MAMYRYYRIQINEKTLFLKIHRFTHKVITHTMLTCATPLYTVTLD